MLASMKGPVLAALLAVSAIACSSSSGPKPVVTMVNPDLPVGEVPGYPGGADTPIVGPPASAPSGMLDGGADAPLAADAAPDNGTD